MAAAWLDGQLPLQSKRTKYVLLVRLPILLAPTWKSAGRGATFQSPSRTCRQASQQQPLVSKALPYKLKRTTSFSSMAKLRNRLGSPAGLRSPASRCACYSCNNHPATLN